MNKILMSIILAIMVSGCTTVTIRDQGTSKINSEPNYSSSKSFFFWGLAGKAQINVSEICGGKAPAQIRTERSFVDGFLGLITLGIYSPRSAYVWCNVDGGV
ncbi:MAG: hypothetical protein KGP28_05775 [Bdellovibrionales bacterium]|nr:hypothetical protein [Bdellovibrionales bacterium]